MSDKEILEKAIKKASINGFDTGEHALGMYDDMNNIIAPVLIFNHDFAKALWGASWKYHLENMVISEDPIAYLGANI